LSRGGFYVSERLAPGYQYWKRGAVGVDLFFVLSGFVMASSSGRYVADPQGWKTFIRRRITRIVPLYWLATTIKLLVLLVSPSFILHAQFSVAKIAASYLFLPSRNVDGEIRPLLAVGWTLNMEMFFYLLLALALKFRWNLFGFMAAVIVPLALASHFFYPGWPVIAFYLNPVVLDFLFGMVIARYFQGGPKLPPVAAALLILSGFAGLFFFPLEDVLVLPMSGLYSAAVVWGVVAGAEAFMDPGVGALPGKRLICAVSVSSFSGSVDTHFAPTGASSLSRVLRPA
jgi:exopolysaccharide production protein ExoZ